MEVIDEEVDMIEIFDKEGDAKLIKLNIYIGIEREKSYWLIECY